MNKSVRILTITLLIFTACLVLSNIKAIRATPSPGVDITTALPYLDADKVRLPADDLAEFDVTIKEDEGMAKDVKLSVSVIPSGWNWRFPPTALNTPLEFSLGAFDSITYRLKIWVPSGTALGSHSFELLAEALPPGWPPWLVQITPYIDHVYVEEAVPAPEFSLALPAVTSFGMAAYVAAQKFRKKK